MPGFQRRKHGTPKQIGKPYPVFPDGQVPEHTKKIRRERAAAWNAEHPERFQATQRRYYFRKKLEGVDNHAKEQFKRAAKRPY